MIRPSDRRDGHNQGKGIGEQEADWRAAEQAWKQGRVLKLPVSGYNRGGLLVDFGSLSGFVPISHLVDMIRASSYDDRIAMLASRVGETLWVKIIEMDRDHSRLVLSERLARDEDLSSQTLNDLHPGDICTGRVTSLRPFGVFVDLGGVEGLIHVSELSWGRVNHPSDVVRVGDEIQVYVMSVDPAARKVGLSLKRLTPDPWSTAAERYRVGEVVEAVITNVVSFGAFARVEEGLEGLIHISELAEGNFLHPRNVVREGDRVKVRILNVDGERHRLGLSLRQVRNERSTASQSAKSSDDGHTWLF
ncbi:MAG TPA: S1 RNA-binding domain-containing protein [Anaerolineae bacterium]|nr:S1 RNA-binding domain-containing protein [Anaerolineae bacterium]